MGGGKEREADADDEGGDSAAALLDPVEEGAHAGAVGQVDRDEREPGWVVGVVGEVGG